MDFFLQIIYRIKLPGPAILGEGKPENQNHAIIFTRGEGLQTIDMNQVNYFFVHLPSNFSLLSPDIIILLRITTWKKL